MIILKDCDKIYRQELVDIFKDNRIDSLDAFVRFVYSYDDNPDIIIRKRWYKKPKNTIGNRLNMLWYFPLFILCIPFRYVMFGYFNVNKNTRLGRVSRYLLGDV